MQNLSLETNSDVFEKLQADLQRSIYQSLMEMGSATNNLSWFCRKEEAEAVQQQTEQK